MSTNTQFILTFIVSVISAAIALLGLGLLAVQAWATLLPIIEQHRNERVLNEQFNRGPYDKGTIARSTRYYVRPMCSNIDPAQEKELRHALVATREDLFGKIDDFLSEASRDRHLLILADSGMGKTSALLNYYALNARRRAKGRERIVLVPLGIGDADERIKRVSNKQGTVLFLDAFDEDVRARFDHRSRIRELMRACADFRRVVITCRTQFFPRDTELPMETGIVRVGPRSAGETGTFEFWKLYLSPFSDEDVRRYIFLRYPFWTPRLRKKALDLALKIPWLSVRPMLLAHIPDIVASGGVFKYSFQLYEAMVQAWARREAGWVDPDVLLLFTEQLAADLYWQSDVGGTESLPYERLLELAIARHVPLENWQISGRSLLNRDADGNYKFAHRSIMEYLYVKHLLSEHKEDLDVRFTEQMERFIIEVVEYHLEEPNPLGYAIEEIVSNEALLSPNALFIKATWKIESKAVRTAGLDGAGISGLRRIAAVVSAATIEASEGAVRELTTDTLSDLRQRLNRPVRVALFILGSLEDNTLELWASSASDVYMPTGYSNYRTQSRSIPAMALIKKEPVIVNDIPLEPAPTDRGSSPILSALAMPLLGHDGLALGALECDSTEKHAFKREDFELVGFFAHLLAVEIDSFRLHCKQLTTMHMGN
jgi:hypothetical protein